MWNQQTRSFNLNPLQKKKKKTGEGFLNFVILNYY